MSPLDIRGMKFLFALILPFAVLTCEAQSKIIKGYIKDALSDERIPFASIEFTKARSGKLSDSAGNFTFRLDAWPDDTLLITYVGYQDFKLHIGANELQRAVNDTLNLVVRMERGKFASEVVVKRTVDRGLLMWRRIVRRKAFNDKFRFQNFSYELYNKLELDLNKLNFDKLTDLRLIRPFKDLIEGNVDTTEGPPFLPVYLTESVSDYYYQKNPVLRREIIKASKTIGIDNESVRKLLGGTDQNVNVYHNFIPVFDKEFVSPISDNGDFYYRYKVVDTQYVNAQRLFHVIFYPKRKGENTFEGDCWVHDTSFAIQKMTLSLSKEANINFVNKLTLIQEFTMLPDGTWFLSKDKFVVDVSPIGKNKAGAIGRKTTTYKNFHYNDTTVIAELKKNKLKEEIIVLKEASQQQEENWNALRHEGLSKNEQSVYAMIDTLQKMPIFKKYTDYIYFLTVGYVNVGNYELGPWYNWVTYNQLEGTRLRFDLGTNTRFSKKIWLHGYLAYGFLDKKFKYKLDATYLFKKNPRTHLKVSYLEDIDYGQSYYDEISQDNIFALAVRKSGVPIKFLMIDEKKIEFMHEWKMGLGATITTIHKTFDPLRNLPPKDIFGHTDGNDPLSTSEISLRLRYAYLERFLESTFNRISLGAQSPILEAKITKGISGLIQSSYDYTKLNASISDYIKIAPYGSIYYNFFGGKTYGKLPYMLLDIAPGNEIYYYNKYAFNLMNRYEFLHDQYAGVNFEHNIGNGIFRFIPGIRRLKLRQFYSAKGLWGSLSDVNRDYNMPVGSQYRFESLNGRTYLEVGTGVDNIFKFFRVDFVWRVMPRPLPVERVKRFGIFGSFRVAF
jgi:hypothetical protein